MTQTFDLGHHLWQIKDREQRERANRPLATTSSTSGSVDGDTVIISDPAKYAASALERAVTEFANTGRGNIDEPAGRNQALNTAAFTLGKLVHAGLLNEDLVRDQLLHACEGNGLLAWTGSYACERTIRSGLDAAAREPLDWAQGAPSQATPAAPFVPAIPEQPIADEERTTWWPRDLVPILNGDADPEPPPAYLLRADMHALFYAGKVNGLVGESESGKTWVALIAVAQSLAGGQRVLYLDFEDTAAGIVERLRALGVRDKHLGNLTYISPDENLNAAASRDLGEVVATTTPRLVIVDGYNAAMTLLGLDLTSNTDVTSFSLRVLRPLKRTGAAVITIDHVTKSKDNRGSYAIGAQAKRADIDGCLIMVDVAQPFGRGNTGRLKLTVSKDRPGHVRAISGGAKRAGEVVLRSSDDGTITVTVEPPDLRPADERGPFRPTNLMERVSEFVHALSEPMSKTKIKENVKGNNEHIFTAINTLVTELYLAPADHGAGLISIKSYREIDDPASDKYAPRPNAFVPPSQAVPSPSLSRPTGSGHSPSHPSPPLPRRGTEGRDDTDETTERYR